MLSIKPVERRYLAEFRQHLPGLSAWMESCYSSQPILHGDPLGPLGFALTLHNLASLYFIGAEHVDLG